ncbi:MAG: 3-hydroxyacyl-CoA dehydrogenase NAD-binding domain-containing protein, partial [Longimicrobiales bacterium]|nr:3-hydroxyacyl-CoA dehydrogenase NAD-binding domain-containing protein [Longimicrobiales bacterium]
VIGRVENPDLAEAQIRLGQAIFSNVTALPVPTVAAVHGLCVGGGVEMSLSCDYRVLSDSDRTTMSLPEVQLGILPAWGGTTRLPRLIGLQAALDMLLTGKRVRASKAKRIGLASAVVPAPIFQEAVRDFTLGLIGEKGAPRTRKRSFVQRALDDTPPGRRVVLHTARKKVLQQTGGHYPAPLAILDILGQTLSKSVEEGLAAEAREAASLLVGAVCKNLVHVFHMREASRKGTGLPTGSSAEPRSISKVGVLGAGVMGGGIAHLAASRGIESWMKDIEHEAVTGGLQHARGLFDKAVKRRRMNVREATQAMESISGGVEYHGLSGSDVVVEAIVEKMEVKKAVLAELEDHVSADCIIATNTSSLSVEEMASALSRPERFCGMHFFNPVHRMPLVEVIRAPGTSDEAVATIYRLALDLGKVPVVVGDGPGFLVNRILGPYLNEAGFLLSDGASIEMIDRVAKRFGMPMGPLRLVDEVGIDVSSHAGASLHGALGDRLTPAPALLELGRTGRLGKKGGLGFYRYEDGKDKGIDDSIYAELPSVPTPGASEAGTIAGADGERVVRRRLVLAMINEAARILGDGIAASAADVDLAMIMGTGFPPFRGGLLRFADTLHPRGLVDRLEQLAEVHGERFTPAPTLVRLALKDQTLYTAFPAGDA